MATRKPTQADFDALERERDFYKRQLDERRRDPGDMPTQGCGDSSCIVESAANRDGQHTNGGCRCELHTMRRVMAHWRRVAEFREETIRIMRDEAKAKEWEA